MRSGFMCKPLFAAALVFGLAMTTALDAKAYRRGLTSSLGGATLGRGHVIFVAAGYPRTTIGWGVALGSRFDLGLRADIYYGSPLAFEPSEIGGGGGLEGRVALVRGRVSAALVFGFAATVFKEGGGVMTLLDLGSPSAELSLRLSDRIAFHGAVRGVLGYVTRPSDLVGGFEARLGATFVLYSALALFLRLSSGATIWSGQKPATPRLEGLVGLEYRLRHRQ